MVTLSEEFLEQKIFVEYFPSHLVSFEMGSGGTGADVLPQLHRKQFLKAGYVALSVVTPEFAVGNRKTNSNQEKIERPLGRSLSFLEGK